MNLGKWTEDIRRKKEANVWRCEDEARGVEGHVIKRSQHASKPTVMGVVTYDSGRQDS